MQDCSYSIPAACKSSGELLISLVCVWVGVCVGVCVLSHSIMSNSLRPYGLMAHQAPPPVGFPRQEYGSGLPFPTPGNLLNPGIKPASLASPALAGGFFTTGPPGKQ